MQFELHNQNLESLLGGGAQNSKDSSKGGRFEAVCLFAYSSASTSASTSNSKSTTTSHSSASSADKTLFLSPKLTEDVRKILKRAHEQGVLTGAAQEVVFFRDALITRTDRHDAKRGAKAQGNSVSSSQHLVVLGLGPESEVKSDTIRQAVAVLQQSLKAQKVKSLAVALDSLNQYSEEFLPAMVEGLELAAYNFREAQGSRIKSEVKSAKAESKSKAEKVQSALGSSAATAVSLQQVSFVHADGFSSQTRQCINNAQKVAQAVCFARLLGDMPGNLMTPKILAEEVKKASRGIPQLNVDVWNLSRIQNEKMNLFLSVSHGSSEEPRFIVMEYKGAQKKKSGAGAGAAAGPIFFVGKGVTFDSGGISIKPSGGMEEMKFDMCGAAAVIGAVLAISRMGLKVDVTAIVPATENMPGPTATKPGDIIIGRNGKSVEINNTDAEGRLILADALVWACEQKPKLVVDVATLTGAMIIALGSVFTGLFTRSEDLRKKILEASEKSGEWVWPMPITDFHLKDIKGTYADLSNLSASGRGAGSSTAAAFLEQFVAAGVPWAHLDIAGTGWNTGDRWPTNPKKGASGVMVRTLVELARQHAE